MIKWILRKLLGSHNAREIKRVMPVVEKINQLEPQIQKLSDAELRTKTDEFRARLKERLSHHQFISPNTAEWHSLEFEQRHELKRQRKRIETSILNEILPEAFAVVREAARRTVNMRHFDVQLVGGIVLHEGKISEMATGEGKTLVATLAAYLNALTGRGVHIVTVNDYLARRDARWMGPIYHSLGLSIGVIQGVDPAERRPGDESLSFIYDPDFKASSDRFMQLRPVGRKEAYQADITYGQNNEFGFDYLRDNMRLGLDDLVQREFHYAIVDEVDSILIDEARTPLIISGPAEESTELYYRIDKVVDKLSKAKDYEVDEKQKAVSLTEDGIKRCEELLGVGNLYDELNMRLVHHINQALRAHELFKRDVDYMIKDDEVIIVDEFTGRLMPGRRWSDGLHQAIEAKENVKIREENQTLATVTFQNYFRMYEKLCGMTGTAATEAVEFREIYHLDVVVIPTNRTLVRLNSPDVVYKTEAEKFLCVVEEISELHSRGQPVLVGTISIEKSELLSRMLKEPSHALRRIANVCKVISDELKNESLSDDLKAKISHLISRPALIQEQVLMALLADVKLATQKSMMIFRLEDLLRLVKVLTAVKAGIPHNVLNAKYHENEARIVAQAGRFGAVTIATNMAGRGTDILLGGNPQFLAEDAIREMTKDDQGISDEEKQSIFAHFQQQSEQEKKKVIEAGGLHVLGTERHEARRIDNQLRGRSGRQGDPGSSRFYLSLEDDLMRIFGSDRLAKLMEFKWFQWEEGMPIEHPWVSRSIETAQRRVEGENFEARKHLLEYDNVMNRQREVIYEQRKRILEGVDLKGLVKEIIEEVADEFSQAHLPKEAHADAWDLKGLSINLARHFGIEASFEDVAHSRDDVWGRLLDAFDKSYEAKEVLIGSETMRQLERNILMAVVDSKWKDHLYMMDALREGIGLRAYGQRNPLVEYQHEAYAMFQDMVSSVKSQALTYLLKIQPRSEAAPVSVFSRTPQREVHEEVSTRLADRFASKLQEAAAQEAMQDAAIAQPKSKSSDEPGTPYHRAAPKVGRNDPCSCGSGLKYKKCHGK